MLTEDQRHVLASYDQGMLADLIIRPEYGMSRIKSAHAGGSARGNAPEWLRWCSTDSSGIHGGQIGEKLISVTFSQLAKWAASIPAEIREKLGANNIQQSAERMRTLDWCYCPWAEKAPNDHSHPCKRYHPTDVEENKHIARFIELSSYEKVYVGQAIWSGVESGQLDLFDGVSV